MQTRALAIRITTRDRPFDEWFEARGGKRHAVPPRVAGSIVGLPDIDDERDGLLIEERLDRVFVREDAVGAALGKQPQRGQLHIVLAGRDRRGGRLVET